MRSTASRASSSVSGSIGCAEQLQAALSHAAPPALASSLLSQAWRCCTIRSPAPPSQSSGIRAADAVFPSRIATVSLRMRVGSVPTTRFVPLVTVTGLSVDVRSVKQGTPRTVVSSCTPPESVRTSRAFAAKLVKSRYPSGSVTTKPGSSAIVLSRPTDLRRAAVRGWSGRTTGRRRETSRRAPTRRRSVSGSSTFSGR